MQIRDRRRLLKNRAYSKLGRNRTEEVVTDLVTSKHTLSSEISSLKRENQRLEKLITQRRTYKQELIDKLKKKGWKGNLVQ